MSPIVGFDDGYGHDHRAQHVRQHLAVVSIRPAQHDPERDAFGIRQEGAL